MSLKFVKKSGNPVKIFPFFKYKNGNGTSFHSPRNLNELPRNHPATFYDKIDLSSCSNY